MVDGGDLSPFSFFPLAKTKSSPLEKIKVKIFC
jgi:hypothetical protein